MKRRGLFAVMLLIVMMCLNVRSVSAQSVMEGYYGNGSYRLVVNCYANYGQASFAYFGDGYNQMRVGVTFTHRVAGGNNYTSESAGALTNENYIYVTAETRRLGAVIPVSTGAIGYINDTIVASATDYK